MESASVLIVIEDDPDIRLLVRMKFEVDPRFQILAEAVTAEEAIEMARDKGPGLIVLDHMLMGTMTGLEAAPLLKEAAPNAKIILFTAHEHIRGETIQNPAIDAFLLKTQIDKLVPLAQQLVGLEPL